MINRFRKFMNCLDEEIAELGNAVRNHHMNKGKETPEELFLLQVFDALPKGLTRWPYLTIITTVIFMSKIIFSVLSRNTDGSIDAKIRTYDGDL
jgi:hypothetical protein